MTTKTKHATTAGRKAISSPIVERNRLTSQKDKAKVNVRLSKDKPRNSAAKAKAKINLKVGGVAPRNGTIGPLPGTQLLRTLLPTGLAILLPMIHLLLKGKKEIKD